MRWLSGVWKKLGGEFVRFFIVGLVATILHWGIYVALNALFNLQAPQDQFALNITYSVGYALSFIANYIASLKWTFKTKGSVGKGVGFAFSHVVNYGMHLVMLNFFLWLGAGQALVSLCYGLLPWLVDLFPILSKPDTLLPLPVYMVVFPVNFLLVRFFLKYGDEKKLD